MKRERDAGFGVVEVLIALAIVAIVLGSVVANNVALAEINTRAQVQSLAASAAEGVAQRYANALPVVGEQRSGPVTDVLPLRSLSDEDRAVWNTLTYTLSRPSNQLLRIRIARQDTVNDPNALVLEVTP